MASPFQVAAARSGARMLARFGEAVTILPRVVDQYTGPTQDPDRTESQITAVISFAQSLANVGQYRQGSGEISGTATMAGLPTVIWTTDEVYAGLGYAVRRGDALRLDDRTGTPVYVVSLAVPNNAGGTSFHVVAE